MKIRSQTSVLFIPLFIAFVLANGLYYLTGKSQEVEWGIQESIQAVAVTVNSVIEQYGIERGVEKVKNLLKKMKEKKERLSYLVGLQVYDIASKNILINWNLIQSKSIEKSASFEITKSLSIIEETEFGTNSNKIAMMVFASNDIIYKCFFDYQKISEKTNKAILGVVIFSLVALFFSIFVSLYISSIIIQPIREMLQIANTMNAMEQISKNLKPTRIQEFDDLSGTLETVQSVVLDTVRTTQKQLIESEQTRDSLEITKFLNQSVSGKTQEKYIKDNFEYGVSACFTGKMRPGQFIGTNENWVYGGMIRSRKGKPVEYDAFSISRLAYEALQQETTYDDLKKYIINLFAIDYGCFVKISSSQLDVYIIENDDLLHKQVQVKCEIPEIIVIPVSMSESMTGALNLSKEKNINKIIDDSLILFSDQSDLFIIAINIYKS